MPIHPPNGSKLHAETHFFDSSLNYFDTDEDGMIVRNEFVDRPNPFFFAYDTDKDCRVTEREESAAGK
jgi:Ca2+-binding EF-hand superfamily protein